MNAQDIREQIANLQAQLEVLKAVPETVQIPNRDYEVGKTHVTVAQYRVFCEDTQREMPKQPDPHRENNPVVNVTWYDAQDYCAWLSEQTDEHWDLLSDDEYEYCCGDHKEGNPDIAVYDQAHIAPVASKEPNKFGLYDMLGNAWQWLRSSA